MSKYLDAASAILQDADEPLTADDIVKAALKAGLITTKGSTPGATMGSMLYTDIARGSSRFAKRGLGRFVLSGAGDRTVPPQGGSKNEADQGGPRKGARGRTVPPRGGGGRDPGGRRAEAIKRDLWQDSEEIDDARGSDLRRRVGAAGEFRVMSELLLRGYDADRITIDSGIDIRAAKNGNVYEIQVKTATERKVDNRYITTIKKESFKRVGGPLLYYVFVLRNRHNGIMYVVIPNKEMKTQIKNGNITKNEAGYQVSFSIGEGSLFLRKENVDSFLNEWDL